jgi:hypothetical protein
VPPAGLHPPISAEVQSDNPLQCETVRSVAHCCNNQLIVFISSGLKPHVCKNCTYCAADPACLYRHMVALHNYAPGTVPRKGRSSTHSDSIQEPTLPSSPSSDYSDLTTDAWTRSAAPSPSSATYSHPSSSPSHSSASPDELFPSYPSFILSSCVAEFSVLPASPTSPSGWLWDNQFEAAFFPVCEKSPIVECTPSPGPSKQYPAEGIEFFDATGAFLPPFFDVGKQPQQPWSDPSPVFFPPSTHPVPYPLETFASCGLEGPFVGEWTGALC